VVKAKSTERFDGLPYLLSLLNCCICLWYGLPWVSDGGRALVATVNGTGALFQLAYISLFVFYADSRRTRVSKMGSTTLPLKAVCFLLHFPQEMTCSPPLPQLKIVGLLVLEAFVFAVIAHASIAFLDQPARQLFVGSVSMASLISMFASPLAVMVLSPKLSARFVSSSFNSLLLDETAVSSPHHHSHGFWVLWLFRVW